MNANTPFVQLAVAADSMIRIQYLVYVELLRSKSHYADLHTKQKIVDNQLHQCKEIVRYKWHAEFIEKLSNFRNLQNSLRNNSTRWQQREQMEASELAKYISNMREAFTELFETINPIQKTLFQA